MGKDPLTMSEEEAAEAVEKLDEIDDLDSGSSQDAGTDKKTGGKDSGEEPSDKTPPEPKETDSGKAADTPPEKKETDSGEPSETEPPVPGETDSGGKKDAPPEPPKEEPLEKAEKRVKDAQQKMHEATLREAEAEKRNIELKRSLLVERKKNLDLMKKYAYTETELEELKTSDPDAYIDAVKMKGTIETEESEITKEEKALATLEAQKPNIYREQELNLYGFLETQGLEVNYDEPLEKQNDDVIRFVTSPEFTSSNELLGKFDASFTLSPRELLVIYRGSNFDQLVKKEVEKALTQGRQAGYDTAVTNIGNASAGGSQLDRVPKDAHGKQMKSIDDMTQAEIEALPEEEVNRLSKELGLSSL